MVVDTRGEKARRLARTALELLLASHPVDCANCPSNGSCELQKIAKHLGVKLNTRRFRKTLRDLPLDDSNPVLVYDPNKCVLCGRCVWACQRRSGGGCIDFAYRGFRRKVTAFCDEPVGECLCGECRDCISVCPVGALVPKEVFDK